MRAPRNILPYSIHSILNGGIGLLCLDSRWSPTGLEVVGNISQGWMQGQVGARDPELQQPLILCVEEYIRDVTTRKEYFIIQQLTTTKAEVEGLFKRHKVDIESHMYTCEMYNRNGNRERFCACPSFTFYKVSNTIINKYIP
ncbi:hypothetical protein IEQ34_015979 [Dendrobium chrysotoxum]|uniref:Uncharacterized protein n=1 Tax=Dendrobium chrysotoxum TaxID=161865 RepID=A0AAV7GJ36_DENCH|nr:hypothetical protein IEQ34_015979 [Dendrobium chrysotoxum]